MINIKKHIKSKTKDGGISKMKIFIDTANINEIEQAMEYGVIDGVTTNPTLVSREGNVNFHQHIKKIWYRIYFPI